LRTSARKEYFVLFVLPYSAEIAPVGQVASQVPHSRHASASITYLPSPSLIASAGHSPAQVPHATHSSEITYAIVQILLHDLGYGQVPPGEAAGLYHILIQEWQLYKHKI
jgi:hypothetical protein